MVRRGASRRGSRALDFRRAGCAAAIVVTVLVPVWAGAEGPAYLVEDIRTLVPEVEIPDEHNDVSSSYPENFTELDGIVYFSASDDFEGYGPNGGELWRTDGTEDGTWLVRDIFPGKWDSYPHDFVVLNNRLLFVADGVQGHSLWSTDGTAAGTRQIRHPPSPGNRPPGPVLEVGGRVFFLLNDVVHGQELWITDGTDEGTHLVKDINPGRAEAVPSYEVPCPGPPLVRVGSQVFFAADDGAHGIELWRSDGTERGTVMVSDVDPGVASSCPSYLTEADGALYFAASTAAEGMELWRSDGTEAGTWIVADIRPGPDSSSPHFLTALNGGVVFAADDGLGREIWRSDGTSVGTFSLTDIDDGSDAFDPAGPVELTRAAGELFFVVYRRSVGEFALWRTDGTAAGTKMVKDHLPHRGRGEELTPFRGRLFFKTHKLAMGPQLWSSDGTEANTSPIRTFHPPGSNEPWLLTPVGAALYFAADDGSGMELWRSDGTTDGTVLVKEINPGAADTFPLYGPPAILVAYQEALYFGARSDASVGTLWRSDGSAAGTLPVGNPQPNVFPAHVSNLTVAGEKLYFSSYDETLGWQLWESDGTAQGTRLVADLSAQNPYSSLFIRGLKTEALFAWSETERDVELWKLPGPTRVADINPGAEGSYPTNPVVVGDRVLFGADDGIHGRELWSTDGTEQGTFLVKDTQPGFQGGVAFDTFYRPVALGNLLIFVADGGDGLVLWRSDGTEEGTFPISTVEPTYLVSGAGAVFFVGRDELHGGELWRSDGTREGTVLLADINAGPEGSLISQYIALKDDVLFFADDGIYGYELWGSNGSPQGTRLVADILPGPTSSAEQFSVSMVPGEVDGIALFAATDGEHGLELWRSDGTAHGTWLVQDIATGPGSSSPTRIVPAGEQIFFLANDNRHGWELWAMPRRAVDGPAPQPLRPVSGEGCQTSTTSGGASMVVVLGSIVLWTLAARAPARRASRPRCRPNG